MPPSTGSSSCPAPDRSPPVSSEGDGTGGGTLMTRFAGLPFVVIDDGTLPADTVPRLLPFATSVAVISADAASPVAEQFLEAGVPAIVHARGGALLSHAAAHSVHS